MDQLEVDTVSGTQTSGPMIVEEECTRKNLHDSILYHLILPDGDRSSAWEGHFFPPWCSAETLVMLIKVSAGLKG